MSALSLDKVIIATTTGDFCFGFVIWFEWLLLNWAIGSGANRLMRFGYMLTETGTARCIGETGIGLHTPLPV